MVTLFTDLDDTLIYGHRVLGDSNTAVLVETLDGKPLSYMTLESYSKLSSVLFDPDIVVVPLTTRVLHQYTRIQIPRTKYALISNGATLLVNGTPDEDWQKESVELVKPYVDELRQLLFVIGSSGFRHSSLAFHDNMFINGKFENPWCVKDYIQKRIVDGRYSVYVQHQKVYIIPKVLEKGRAIERFCKRFETGKVVSAGDNLLDFPWESFPIFL